VAFRHEVGREMGARHQRFSERGQGLTEYALILALIAVLLLAALLVLQDELTSTYSYIVSSLPPR
jgi:Flp pilus assembly pilin Flp